VAVAAVAQAAHGGEMLIEDFDGDVIDLQRWSILDQPGDGVTIRQENGRLEFSSAGGFSSGAAAIFSRDAFSTDTDIRVIVDYNLTVENPGASAVGLNVALFNGGDAASEDRIDIAIFRSGSLFFVDWFFIADGAQVDSGFSQTTANVDELTLFYRAATDTLTVSSDESASSDPVAVVIHGVVQHTGTQGLQLYLGGFVSGATSAVNGSDAFYDNLLVDGCIADGGDGGDDGSAPLYLDARDDSDSFRRGTAADDRLGWSVRYAGDIDQDGISDVIVGVPHDDATANNAGSVSVLAGADGTLIFERHGVAAGDWLGFTAEGAGDWNGDGGRQGKRPATSSAPAWPGWVTSTMTGLTTSSWAPRSTTWAVKMPGGPTFTSARAVRWGRARRGAWPAGNSAGSWPRPVTSTMTATMISRSPRRSTIRRAAIPARSSCTPAEPGTGSLRSKAGRPVIAWAGPWPVSVTWMTTATPILSSVRSTRTRPAPMRARRTWLAALTGG
jgi:hypothetical protein